MNDQPKDIEAAKGVIAFNQESSESSESIEGLANCLNAITDYKAKKEFWMENVRSLTVDVNELVEKELKEFGIVLTPEQEDYIHDAVWKILEDVSNGDYRSHN